MIAGHNPIAEIFRDEESIESSSPFYFYRLPPTLLG